MRDAQVAEWFARDAAELTMIIRHDHGLYRHLELQHAGGRGFELITVPGKLIFQLPRDVDVFSRSGAADMFACFIDSAVGGVPNVHYWAGALVAKPATALEYSPEVLADHLHAEMADAFEGRAMPGDLVAAVQREVVDHLSGDETEDRRRVSAFRWHGSLAGGFADLPAMSGFRFHRRENCRDYLPMFRWKLHAILWAIHHYQQMSTQTDHPEGDPGPCVR